MSRQSSRLSFEIENNPQLSFFVQTDSDTPSVFRYIPGTWQDTQLASGNIQSQFTVFSRLSAASTVDGYSYYANANAYFEAVAQQATYPTGRERCIVRQEFRRQDQPRRARVVSGRIEVLDDAFSDRFHIQGEAYFRITFERLPNWEVGPPRPEYIVSELEYNGSVQRLPDFFDIHGPGRLSRVSVRNSAPSDDFRISKLWLAWAENEGENHDTIGLPRQFDPSIEFSFGNAQAAAPGTYIQGSPPDEGFNYNGFLRIGYYPSVANGSIVDRTAWQKRFHSRLITWNDTARPAEFGAAARRGFVGRYLLLMRYKTGQNLAATGNADMRTGLRATCFWGGGAGVPQVYEGARMYIPHEDDWFHWIQLGEIVIGGEDWSHVQNGYLDPAQFSIGIDAAGINIPQASRQQYIFYIDKFMLIPADNYVAVEVDGNGVGTDSSLEILTDDTGRVSAYMRGAVANSAQRVTKLPNVTSNGWRMPRNIRSQLIGVAETYQYNLTPSHTFSVRLVGQNMRRSDV